MYGGNVADRCADHRALRAGRNGDRRFDEQPQSSTSEDVAQETGATIVSHMLQSVPATSYGDLTGMIDCMFLVCSHGILLS